MLCSSIRCPTFNCRVLSTANPAPSNHAAIGAVPEWITFTPDSQRVYDSNSGARSVSVIDAKTLKLLDVVNVGEVPKRITRSSCTDTLTASLHVGAHMCGDAFRSSEILALRWADVHWHEGRIQISKRWAKGEDGETKTDVSDGYVPLHSLLAGHLRAWQCQTPHE